MEVKYPQPTLLRIFLPVCLTALMFLPGISSADGMENSGTDTQQLIQILKDKGLLTDEDLAKIQTRIKEQKEKKAQDEMAPVKIQGRVQFRYMNIEDFDPSTKIPPLDANGFRLQRVRLFFSGTAVPKVDYYIHLNFDQGTDGRVWDAYLQYNISPEWGHVRMGQYKVPFGRQWLASSARFLFMNRSNIGDYAGFRRDIGVMYEKYSFTEHYQDAFAEADMTEPNVNYAFGIFNGNHIADGNGFLSGSDLTSARVGSGNDNDQYLYVSRLSLTPVKREEGFKYLTFGASAAYQKQPTNGERFIQDDTKKALFDVTSGNPWKASDWEAAWEVDSQWIIGQAVFQAEYLRRKLAADGLLTFTNARQARSVTADGWYVQGGYFVVPKKLSLNARYETYDPNNQVKSQNDYDRYTLGFNYYINGNNFKLQGDYNWQDEAVEDLNNDFWELQLQLLF